MAEIRTHWETLGKPRVVAACSSCLAALRAGLPDMPVISLWQALAEECPAPGNPLSGPMTLSIHDPCTARRDQKWLASVRILLERHGVRVDEPRLSGKKTACCGYGGLAWNARPAVAAAMTAHRASQLSHTAVASCIMCRDRLAAEGTPCLHLLDILFPPDDRTPAVAGHPGPGLSARRSNRAALKRRALREIGGRPADDPAPEDPPLFLEDDVLHRLESRHILRQDVALAVRESEAAKSAFLDRQTGRFLGSWRPSRVTYWVEYSPEAGGYRIHDAYSHRMVVPGTGNVRDASADTGFGSGGDALAFRPAAKRGGG
jgi:hypothetical protein